ncbi:hypothetical protein AOLI_G00175920 [Acnodon oligacanthus]
MKPEADGQRVDTGRCEGQLESIGRGGGQSEEECRSEEKKARGRIQNQRLLQMPSSRQEEFRKGTSAKFLVSKFLQTTVKAYCPRPSSRPAFF